MINIPTSFLYVTRVTGVYIGGKCFGGRPGVTTCIAAITLCGWAALGVCCPFFDVAGFFGTGLFSFLRGVLWFWHTRLVWIVAWVGGVRWLAGWLVDGICGWMDGISKWIGG